MTGAVKTRLKRKPVFWQVPLLLAACVAFCAVLNLSGVLESFELKTLDWRLHTRDKVMEWLGHPPKTSNRIVLVEIDDESTARFPEPFLFWDRYFTSVVNALTRSGVKVIGIDILWLKSAEDFVELKWESPRRALVRALLTAGSENRLALASYEGAQSLGRYGLALRREDFAPVNPWYDADKLVRRQKLFYPAASGASESFPLAVARRYAGESLKLPSDPTLIDFHTRSFPFRKIPFHEAYARASDARYYEETFAGKIVLLGTSASLLDRFATPLGRETPGLHTQAFAVETLLEQRPFVFQGRVSTVAAIALLAIFAGLLVLTLSPAAAAATALLLAGLFLAVSVALFQARIVIDLAGPLAGLLTAFVAVLAYRFTIMDRDKRRVAGKLKSYLDERVVKRLAEEADAPGFKGERRMVCVMFTDLRDFTSLSEGMSSRKLVRILNAYLSEMSRVILEHDGSVDKFMGDGIMAHFNDDAAFNAVKAALVMQEALRGLNARWARRGGLSLRMGVGITRGQVLLGNVGSYRKMDFTLIGDAVNLASRLEGLTKSHKRDILVTTEFIDRVKRRVHSESLGTCEVKGHSAVEVYAILGLNDDV